MDEHTSENGSWLERAGAWRSAAMDGDLQHRVRALLPGMWAIQGGWEREWFAHWEKAIAEGSLCSMEPALEGLQAGRTGLEALQRWSKGAADDEAMDVLDEAFEELQVLAEDFGADIASTTDEDELVHIFFFFELLLSALAMVLSDDPDDVYFAPFESAELMPFPEEDVARVAMLIVEATQTHEVTPADLPLLAKTQGLLENEEKLSPARASLRDWRDAMVAGSLQDQVKAMLIFVDAFWPSWEKRTTEAGDVASIDNAKAAVEQLRAWSEQPHDDALQALSAIRAEFAPPTNFCLEKSGTPDANPAEYFQPFLAATMALPFGHKHDASTGQHPVNELIEAFLDRQFFAFDLSASGRLVVKALAGD